jgi:hypothetical protein
MGWPGTGRPGMGRGCVLPCAVGAAGRTCGGGAWYTGRGPVWGTIMRRAGGGGGGMGRGAGCACIGAEGAGGAVGRVTTTAGGAGGRTGGAGGAATAGGGVGAAAGGGGVATGAAVGGALGAGPVSSGAAGLAGGAGGTGGFMAGAAGLVSSGGAGGGATGICRAGGALGACCWVIAFSTSPGLEMCDRSILVRMESSGRGARAFDEPAPLASACLAKCARTRTASSTSMELECVFFSVTPTSGSTSRMALLFTSSSRAKSLIRIFCIRSPFPP